MMDIAEAGLKNGLFIPTAGQWEQEYLSRYYEDEGWFFSRSQHGLRLAGTSPGQPGSPGFLR